MDLDIGSGVLVALHGHADEPALAREWGRRLAPPGWEVVAPGAPLRDGVRSWFSSGPRGVDAAHLADGAERVRDLVSRVRSSGRPVVVAGFSQGAALAVVLDRFGVRPDAVVGICGFWPETELPELDPEPGGSAAPGRASTAAPVLLISASEDEVVPPFLGEDVASTLAAAGRSTDWLVVEGGHSVGPRAAALARDWLVATLGRGPRVSMGLPVDRVGTELCGGAAIRRLASLYERLGVHAAHVTDHPAPDVRWLDAGGHHALEPTVALGVAAAASSQLLLHTNVYVLAYRNPFLAAKALASVDVVSDGRLILGVAAGYLRPEFAALGADFDRRGDRLDEALDLLSRVWSGEEVEASGDRWSARGVRALPRPVQRPRPPVWVGGNSVAAMRRAVARGDGWSPFPTPPGAAGALRTAAIGDLAALRTRLARLDELREEAGRTERLSVCFVPFGVPAFLADPAEGLGPLVDEVAQLADEGVDWVAVSVPGSSVGEVGEHAEALSTALGLR